MFTNPFPVPDQIALTLISSSSVNLTENYFHRVDRLLEDNGTSFSDYYQFIRYNNVSWFDMNKIMPLNVPSHRDIVVLFRR